MKGYRTIVFNGLVLALTFAAEVMSRVGDSNVLLSRVPDHFETYVLLGVLVSNVFLRTITTTPVGKK